MREKKVSLKLLSVVLTLITTLSILYAGSITANAVSGPRPSDEAGIVIGFTHFGDSEIMYLGNSKKTTVKFENFTYTKKNNTLTIENTGSNEEYYLAVYDMGDDFKINVKGKNSLSSIAVYSNAKDRMNLTITGTGTLTVNKGGGYGAAIHGYANGKSNTKITIDNTVNLKLYGGYNEFEEKNEKVIEITGAKSGKQSDVFKIGGKKTGSTKVSKSKTKKGYNYKYGGEKLIIKKSGKSFLKSSSSSSTSAKKTTTKTYTVKYSLNGGKGNIGNQKKTKGKNLKLSTKKPTRSGYVFKGWSVKKNGTVKYKAGATYKADSSVTLYAKWAKKEGNVYGVAIAVSTSDMRGATKNSAKLFVESVKARYPKGYKCNKSNVKVKADDDKYLLTKSEIRTIIKETYNKSSTDNDIYYIGYFGHGKADEAENGAKNGVGFYVKPTKKDKDDHYPYKEFLSMVMEEIPKGDVVLFIDACYSGCYASNDAINSLSSRDRERLHIITSANAHEGSNNKVDPFQFILSLGKTYMLGMYDMGSGLDMVVEPDDLQTNISAAVKALRADSNKDKKVTMKEIHSYMKKAADGLEHPQYYSKKAGFVIFAKR